MTGGDEGYWWPVFRFDIPPRRIHHFHHQFRSDSKPNNFLKGVKWSPDGYCFITCSEDNMLRIFDFPINVDGSHVDASLTISGVNVDEGEGVTHGETNAISSVKREEDESPRVQTDISGQGLVKWLSFWQR